MTVITVTTFQFAKDFDLLEMKLNIVITINGPLLKEVGWRNYWPAGLECQDNSGDAVECGKLK
jgi:hypothetical protein